MSTTGGGSSGLRSVVEPVRSDVGDRGEVALEVAPGLGYRVAAELLEHRVGEHERDHRLGDDARGGHGADVGALVVRLGGLAGRDVDRAQRVRHGGDRLHAGPHAQQLAGGHSALGAAGAVAQASDAGRRRSTSSSWACEPRRVVVRKPSPTSTPLIAWMPMSAAASCESSRRSQCTYLPSPGGTP